MNQAYLDYFGVEKEKLLHQSAVETDFAPNLEVRARMQEILEQTGQISRIELDLPSLPGGERTVMASLQRVEVEGEQQVISSFMDITERVRAEKQIRALASELTMAEQAERHRISRLLHDELQQRLFAIRMQLSFLRPEHTSGEQVNVETEISQLENWLNEAIEVTRDLSIELSPRILQDEGLLEAVTWLSSQMEEKFGLQVELNEEGMGVTGKLENSTRILLYQAIREILFNVIKHSGTLEAQVNMQQTGDHLNITITDYGGGFDAKSMQAGKLFPHGLAEIEKKLIMMGCSMKIESTPGIGTRVSLDAPISMTEG